MRRTLAHASLRLSLALFAAWLVWLPIAPAAPVAEKKPIESAVKPVPRQGKGWMDRHLSMNERVKQGNVDLVFIGDSITHGWERNGKAVWDQCYAGRNAVNLGIGGDRTQHVLWRLENGNLEGIAPKLAVIMIGTNNSGDNTPAEIAAGVKRIVQTIRAKTPETKILVLAIFPRGKTSEDPRHLVNVQANAIIAKLADGKNVFFQDIGAAFLRDGKLTAEVMPDFLHLTPESYTLWAKAIEPTVARLMGEKK